MCDDDAAAVIARAIDAANRHDVEGWLALLDPDVELHAFRGLQRGRDEARAWMGTPGYEELDQELELERVVEACDQVVALVVRRFRWKSDGSLADEHRMGHLYRIRDGLIVRWQPFLDPADALRAAGIDENDAAV